MRSYLAIKLDKGNDKNGNPCRGWLVYLDTGRVPLLGWIEEGYSGELELYRSILSAENPDASPTPRQGFDLRDSGRVRVLCGLHVVPVEVKHARSIPFSLTRAEG